MPIATREELVPRAQIRDEKTDQRLRDWTKQDLIRRAREIGIGGRSRMTKAELVRALREH